ncbi:hypothetical protein VTK56DRAFT_1923 [Thermocarpiscus australiensis]
MAVSVLAAAATQTSSLDASGRPSSSTSSVSSSPQQYPTDLTHSILEEGDETDSEQSNEPLTPVSGRQSQDFQTLAHQDVHPDGAQDQLASTSFPPVQPGATPGAKTPLIVDTAATTPPRKLKSPGSATSASQRASRAAPPSTPTPVTHSGDQDPSTVALSRRSTFSSTSSFRRTMSSFLRRVGS